MHKLVIKGGNKLFGDVHISGAKNATLPIMAATLLAGGEYKLSNIPKLQDVITMIDLLASLGIVTDKNKFESKSYQKFNANSITPNDEFLKFINDDTDNRYEASYELVKTMRASILVLGPLLAKRKKARVSLPGGCAIGERPVDLHISALQKMGADIKIDHGYIYGSCDRLKGIEFDFPVVTVTGTENILMAATLADGVTILNNAAKEPEVIDLANFLILMGAKIEGAGTDRITVHGVENLSSADYSIMSDRIEAGTFLCAVSGAGGDVKLHNAPVRCMDALLKALRCSGVNIAIDSDGVLSVSSDGRLDSIDIVTNPYPGFPTDMQAQFMALMTKANGISNIDETIFENRLMHVAELKRMGANITVNKGLATVKGVSELSGAPVMASDLRASAGLVIASLMANNTSEVHRVYHLDRGYEYFEQKLGDIGADIKRCKDR